VIGDVLRTFADFRLDVDISSMPAGPRYRDPALGAGPLVDLGVYPLTWALFTLDAGGKRRLREFWRCRRIVMGWRLLLVFC
jgi:predicted dehydrogenase